MLSAILDTIGCIANVLSCTCYLLEEEGRMKRVLILAGVVLLTALVVTVCIYFFTD